MLDTGNIGYKVRNTMLAGVAAISASACDTLEKMYGSGIPLEQTKLDAIPSGTRVEVHNKGTHIIYYPVATGGREVEVKAKHVVGLYYRGNLVAYASARDGNLECFLKNGYYDCIVTPSQKFVGGGESAAEPAEAAAAEPSDTAGHGSSGGEAAGTAGAASGGPSGEAGGVR